MMVIMAYNIYMKGSTKLLLHNNSCGMILLMKISLK